MRYRIVYMNMGHGDKIFTSGEQNKLFENAILWLGTRKWQARALAAIERHLSGFNIEPAQADHRPR